MSVVFRESREYQRVADDQISPIHNAFSFDSLGGVFSLYSCERKLPGTGIGRMDNFPEKFHSRHVHFVIIRQATIIRQTSTNKITGSPD